MKKLYFLLVLLLCFTAQNKAQLIINEVLYDPSNIGLEGDANGDSVYSQAQDEFIEFVNTGSTPLDVSGYQIADSNIATNLVNVVYIVPNGIIIPPSGALVIFGGGLPKGMFGGSIVLADTGIDGLSMNNSGEVILVRNNTSNVVLRFNSDALSNNPDESYTRSPDLTGNFVQHASLNPRKFSPGTKLTGAPFITSVNKQITFKVDMNGLAQNFDSVYVRGNFNQWCTSCSPMLDLDKDGLFEFALTTTLDTLNFYYVYKSGTTFTEENFASNPACTRLFNGKQQRFETIKADTQFASVCFETCQSCPGQLSLKGVMDFITPLAGNSGKAIHVRADAAIANLSIYGLGVANNGGGTDGQEYRFPAISVDSGADILVVRDSAALAAYFASCWPRFKHVFTDLAGVVNQNGDDAIELFKVGEVIETYGISNEDGTGKPWEYTGSWAFKTGMPSWLNGALNCTDSTTTIFDSECIYPICEEEIKVTAITVNSAANTITQNGGTLAMQAAVLPLNATNTTVTWSVDSPSLASISSTGLLTAIANGKVTVKATAKDGSGVFATKEIVISGQSNSLEELLLATVKLYPNPTEDKLHIEANGQIESFQIYNLLGERLSEGPILNQEINIHSFMPGVYFLELTSGSAKSSYKIIKK